MKKLVSLKAVFALLLLVAFYSCSKNENDVIVDESNVVTSDGQAYALVSGIYGQIQTISSSLSFLIESATEGTISFEGEENEPGPVI